MSTDYKHRGCSTPILRYLPDGSLQPGSPVRSMDWVTLPELEPATEHAKLPRCPDCGQQTFPASQSLARVDYSLIVVDGDRARRADAP